MNRSGGWSVIAALGLAVLAPSLRAQNVDEMAKWVSAEVVHYDVVAEFSGTAEIAAATAPGTRSALTYKTQVKDRFEMGFDWSPTAMEMVGKATIKNFPSTLPNGTPAAPGSTCAAPKITGTYDHVEVIDAKTGMMGSNSLALSFKRTYATGSLPYMNELGCNNWADAPVKTVTATHGLVVPPGMYLAMPQATGKDMTIGKDGKTIVFTDKANYWTYTYTLKIVK